MIAEVTDMTVDLMALTSQAKNIKKLSPGSYISLNLLKDKTLTFLHRGYANLKLANGGKIVETFITPIILGACSYYTIGEHAYLEAITPVDIEVVNFDDFIHNVEMHKRWQDVFKITSCYFASQNQRNWVIQSGSRESIVFHFCHELMKMPEEIQRRDTPVSYIVQRSNMPSSSVKSILNEFIQTHRITLSGGRIIAISDFAP